MHVDDGFTYLSLVQETHEAFVDIIEVRPEYRRLGLGKQLVYAAECNSREDRAYQIRGWSSEDKVAPATIYPRGQEVLGYYF